jgi:putative transposase
MAIFKDDMDYTVFLNLLKRHLGKTIIKDKNGRDYPNYHQHLQLLAYCLMPTHFHLFVYQRDRNGITMLLRSVCVAYTMYFNRKYTRVGPLFQSRFKASMIDSDEYLAHITRYIHLNPSDYTNWPYSSLRYYVGNKHTEWLDPAPILELFGGDDYDTYLKQYEHQKVLLDEIKSQIADG